MIEIVEPEAGSEAEFAAVGDSMPSRDRDALAVFLDRPLELLDRLPELQRSVDRASLSARWFELGRVLLAHPFWQVSALGADILASRYRASRLERAPVDQLLGGWLPLPSAHVRGDRDTTLVDLARLVVEDERSPHEILDRVGKFLRSPYAHQRAEALVHLTQFAASPDSIEAIRAVQDFMESSLESWEDERDIWVVHELLEMRRQVGFLGERPLARADNFEIVRAVPGWEALGDADFTWIADQRFEMPGTRLSR